MQARQVAEYEAPAQDATALIAAIRACEEEVATTVLEWRRLQRARSRRTAHDVVVPEAEKAAEEGARPQADLAARPEGGRSVQAEDGSGCLGVGEAVEPPAPRDQPYTDQLGLDAGDAAAPPEAWRTACEAGSTVFAGCSLGEAKPVACVRQGRFVEILLRLEATGEHAAFQEASLVELEWNRRVEAEIAARLASGREAKQRAAGGEGGPEPPGEVPPPEEEEGVTEPAAAPEAGEEAGGLEPEAEAPCSAEAEHDEGNAPGAEPPTGMTVERGSAGAAAVPSGAHGLRVGCEGAEPWAEGLGAVSEPSVECDPRAMGAPCAEGEDAGRLDASVGRSEPEEGLQDERTPLLAAFLKEHGYTSATLPKKTLLKIKYPIHTAAKQGDPHIVRMLIDQGADPAQKTSWGKTAAQIARENDRHGSHVRVLHALGGA